MFHSAGIGELARRLEVEGAIPGGTISEDADPPRSGALDESGTSLGGAALSDHAERALAGSHGAHDDPGLRLNLRMRGNVPGGLPSGGGEGAAGALSFFGERPLGGAADVGLSGTFRTDPSHRSAEDAATVTVGFGTVGVASLSGSAMTRAASLLAQGESVRKSAETVYDDVGGLMETLNDSPDVGRLKELAAIGKGRALTPAEITEALGLAESLRDELRDAASVLARMPKLIDDMEGLVTELDKGGVNARGGALASLFTEETIGARTPTLKVGNHRFDAALRGHLMQPLPMPKALKDELSALDELVALKSSMLAVRAYVDVSAAGLAEVKGLLSDIRGDVESLKESVESGADLIDDALDDPLAMLGEAETFAEETEALAKGLEKDGKALGDRVSELEDAFDLDVEAGIEIEQPTAGTGVGLDEVSARWRWDPNQSFQLAVRAYVEHAVGYLPGTRERLRLDAELGDLVPSGREKVNTYSTFFPRTFGADIGLSRGRDTLTRTDVLVGVASDGEAAAMHLGLTQQLGRRVLLRLGLYDPDVARRRDHTITTTGGIDVNVGPRNDPARATIGLGGGFTSTFGAGQPGGVAGGFAGLNLTIRFGRRPRNR